jgi:hypothetical protein
MEIIMTKKQRRSGFSRNGTSLLLLTPIIAGLLTISATAAATPNITAKASFKGGLLTYSGKLTGAPAGTQVSLFDAASGLLLHAMNTDPKNAFNYSIPLDSAICGVKLKLDNGTTSYLKVSGAPSSTCKTSVRRNPAPPPGKTNPSPALYYFREKPHRLFHSISVTATSPGQRSRQSKEAQPHNQASRSPMQTTTRLNSKPLWATNPAKTALLSGLHPT